MSHVLQIGVLFSVVRVFAHGAMGRRIDPSWSGPIELFLVPASAPQLVQQRLWYVLSCLWDGAYKRTLAVAAVGFPSRYLSGPLPYIRHHITVNIMC